MMDVTTWPLAVLSDDDSEQFETHVTAGGRPGLASFDEFRLEAMGRAREIGGSLAVGRIETKWDLAKSMLDGISSLMEEHPGYDDDARFWNYLALVYSDAIWKAGSVQPGYYVFGASGPRPRYRHRVAGPYLLARRFRDQPEIRALLSDIAANSHGDVLENLLGYKYTINSNAVILVGARLFLDPSTHRIRKGSGNKEGPYTARRYAAVIRQFAVTYDTDGMTAEDLAGLLPVELRRRVEEYASGSSNTNA